MTFSVRHGRLSFFDKSQNRAFLFLLSLPSKQESMEITLEPLQQCDRGQFIKNIQHSFQKAFVEEFGETGEMVLPEEDVIRSLDSETSMTYRILADGAWVGGIVLNIDTKVRRHSLDLFYLNPEVHGKGIGTVTWRMVERLYPETEVWETHTPYFEKRNIHFYVNKCGFHIVEFFNPHHKSLEVPSTEMPMDCFFRFEKRMSHTIE